MKKIIDLMGNKNIPGMKKLFRIMKLTSFFLLISVVSVLAGKTYSQTKLLSLNFENTSVREVLSKIEDQSEFYFMYSEKIVDVNREVSVNIENQKIEKVLNTLFTGTDVDYTVKDRIIVLTTPDVFDNNAAQVAFQQKTVSGKVTDTDDQPLPGVTVIVKGTTQGTVTNVDGNYSLTNIPEDAILAFSFVGMLTQEVEVGNQTTIDVTMAVDAIGIEEVVAIGYGTQKKVNITGSVDVISAEVLENRQASTVSQLLQGVSPGLTFSAGSPGFAPGAELGIQIRGMGSINGNDSPYILIDGVPGDMNRINPDDIESVSVLKDAAASAIYGARAPYGVILITTKSGKKNQKFSASYSFNLSMASAQNLPKTLDSYTYARAINESGVHGAGGQYYSNDVVDRIIAFQEGNFDVIRSANGFPDDATHFETAPNPINLNQWGFNQYGNANRDWYDEYYGSAFNKKHDLSFQGGTEKASFYFSAGYLDQEGVLNYGTDTYDRFNLQGKTTVEIADWWDVSYQTKFNKTTREFPTMDSQGSYDLIFHYIAITAPNFPKFDGYGNYMLHSKIPMIENGGTDKSEINENWQTLSSELRPVKELTIHSDFSYRLTNQFRSNQELTVYFNNVDHSKSVWGPSRNSNITNYHISNTYWTTNHYARYEHSFDNIHNFMLQAGLQFERANNRSLNVRKLDLIVPQVASLETANGDAIANEGLLTWATQGYFGRFNYNYKEKYLLESNVRYDGTSSFRKGKRWGFFPSFSAGWNVYKENFWESSIGNFMNTFKVRGSWGELGNFGNPNNNSFPDILIIPLSSDYVNWIFSPGQGRPTGFAGTPGLINPDLTWESARTLNIGFNTSFFENKLQADFDWFKRTTFDQFGTVEAQPGVIGASLPKANNVTLEGTGWELSLRWNQVLDNGFSYNIGVNVYDNKATIKKYLNPTGTLSDYYEGKEVGEIWGYTVNDLYRTQEELDEYTSRVDLSDLTGLVWNTGDVKYEDITNDDKVDNGTNTVNDHGDLSVIGNSTPRYQYGISVAANYKGFDFSMLWKGVGKRDLWFNGDQNIFWGFRNSVQGSVFENHLDYFRDQEGDAYLGLAEGEANYNLDAYWPRPYFDGQHNNKNRITNTRYLQSGAYARLQNVQLGYTLLKHILSKLNMQKLRFYVSAENLLTFSNLYRGIDPLAVGSGWGTGKTYGAEKIISVGVNITY